MCERHITTGSMGEMIFKKDTWVLWFSFWVRGVHFENHLTHIALVPRMHANACVCVWNCVNAWCIIAGITGVYRHAHSEQFLETIDVCLLATGTANAMANDLDTGVPAVRPSVVGRAALAAAMGTTKGCLAPCRVLPQSCTSGAWSRPVPCVHACALVQACCVNGGVICVSLRCTGSRALLRRICTIDFPRRVPRVISNPPWRLKSSAYCI